MDSGKETDLKEAVVVEEVATVEENIVDIRIPSTTPGKVLITEIFIRISTVPIGMLFREMVNHMLAVKAFVKSLAEDAVTAVHVGELAVAEKIDIIN